MSPHIEYTIRVDFQDGRKPFHPECPATTPEVAEYRAELWRSCTPGAKIEVVSRQVTVTEWAPWPPLEPCQGCPHTAHEPGECSRELEDGRECPCIYQRPQCLDCGERLPMMHRRETHWYCTACMTRRGWL